MTSDDSIGCLAAVAGACCETPGPEQLHAAAGNNRAIMNA
jgi:hypothetical protein